MKSNTSISRALAALCLFALTSTINAHTWVEELRLIASNGSYVGALGYPRSFIPRGVAAAAGDPMSHLIPQVNPSPTDTICKPGTTPGSQVSAVQASGFPRLQAAAGDHVALRYEENGHVTQFINQKGKPLGRGVVYIYATTEAQPTDSFYDIHGVWNTDGTGGDKRGKLIASRNYDDGRCYQANGDTTNNALNIARAKAVDSTVLTEVLCQNDIQLPADIGTDGTYTLYWVWDWSTLFSNGDLSTNEVYTTCMDIDIVSSSVADAGPFTAVQSGVNVNSVAIAEQMNTVFLVDPTKSLQVALDDLGLVLAPGATGSIKLPVLGSLPASGASSSIANSPAVSAKVPAGAPSSVTASKVTTTSAAQSQASASTSNAPKYITMTVEVPVIETVTVTASGSSPAVAKPTSTNIKPTTSLQAPSSAAAKSKAPFFTTVVVSTMITQTVSPSSAPASKASDAVFVSSGSGSASSQATSTETGTKSAVVPVSMASGLYTTATAVPSIQPFVKIRGVTWRN